MSSVKSLTRSEADSVVAEEPILVRDDKEEGWVVYPEDNAYKLVDAMPRDEEGIVHVEASLIAKVKGWWYDTAMGRVDEAVAELGIPWEELQIDEQDAIEAEAPSLTEKLAKVSTFMVKVGRQRSRIDAQLHLARSALDHAVQKQVAFNDSKATIAAKTAIIISASKPLRNAKIEVMEGEALKRSLDGVAEALDIIWKTTSRILSARLKEPVE